MRIALHGYGRMGKAVEQIAVERGHEIVARFGHVHAVDRDALGGSEVVIDFSTAGALDAIVDAAADARVNLVIGTTGWSDRLEDVRARCTAAGIGVVYAANFSPGASVTFALARRAAELLKEFDQYEPGIEERHHRNKKDAPSGTALRIAREVEQATAGRWTPGIASSRAGSEFGLHTLFFDSADDLVEISHRARSRDGFARGAVVAAERIAGRSGFFSFDELLDLR